LFYDAYLNLIKTIEKTYFYIINTRESTWKNSFNIFKPIFNI